MSPRPLAHTSFLLFGGIHSFDVALWATREELSANEQEADESTDGLCTYTPYNMCPHTEALTFQKCLGIIHFHVGRFNLEIVAHECLHAIFGLVRAHGLSLGEDDYREHKGKRISQQEIFCYAGGELIDNVYAWMWDTLSELENSGRITKVSPQVYESVEE